MFLLMPKKKKNKGEGEAPKASKKKKGGMSEVLNESVMEHALEVLSQNDAFIVSVNGQDRYVGMMVTAEDLGGLSKKDRKREDKGQIVEAIKSNALQAIITAEMLENEQIIFIPTPETVDMMGEYGILRNAPFTAAFIDDSGNIEFTDKPLLFDKVVEVIENEGDGLAEALGLEDTSFEEEPDDEAEIAEDDIVEDEESDEPEGFDYDEPEGDVADELGDDETPVYVAPEPEPEPEPEYPPVEDYDEYNEGFVEDEYNPTDDAAYDPTEVDEEAINSAQERTMATIIRKFYSDGLGLEVSSDAFDIQFASADTFVPFNENRPEGWINGYLNQMSIDANTELRALHSQNIQSLRERFMTLLSLHCQQIERTLDPDDITNTYGKMTEALMAARSEQLDELPRLASEKREQLNIAWDAKLREVGEEAAQQARRVYAERHSEAHDAELYRVDADIKDSIEQKTREAQREMNEDRRREAARLLDIGINEILVELSEMHAKMVDDENARRKELQKDMQRFIDENRKDDIARSKALADELAQSEKADKVAREYKEKLDAQTAQFKAQREASLAEIAQIREDHAKIMADKEAASQRQIDDLRSQLADMKTERDKLMESYADVDNKRKSEYESRINQLENDNKAEKDHLEHVIENHRHMSRMAIVAAVIAIIAFLAIGLVAGYFFGTRAVDNIASQVDSKYQSQIPAAVETIAAEPLQATEAASAVKDAPKAEQKEEKADTDKSDATSSQSDTEKASESK